MKDIKDKILKIKESNLKTSWTKAIFATLLVSLVIYLAFNGYLFFRPIPTQIREIIDTEVNSTDITFDTKTIDKLKQRQNPTENTAAPVGKNPFMPY
jgi:hypothetical protein